MGFSVANADFLGQRCLPPLVLSFTRWMLEGLPAPEALHWGAMMAPVFSGEAKRSGASGLS